MRLHIVVAALLWASPALSWDPYPYPLPFDQMAKTAECVFVGKVMRTAVTSDSKAEIAATTVIDVIDCLRGFSCRKKSTIAISYYAQTTKTAHLSVNFNVGQEVIIALKSKCSPRYAFDSEVWKMHKPDAAYMCDVFPESILQRTDQEFSCTDVMFNQKVNGLTYDHVKHLLNSKTD